MDVMDIGETQFFSHGFPMLALPAEIILHVLTFLRGKDLVSVSCSCSALRDLMTRNSFWKIISENVFGFSTNSLLKDWRSYFACKTLVHNSKFRWVAPPWKQGEGENEYGVPSPRLAHTATPISGGRIVYIGGQIDAQHRFDEIHILNTATLKFSKVTVRGPEQPPKFARMSSVGIGNKIYSFGGYDGISQLFDLAVFDADELTWSSVEVYGNSPNPRTNHACAALDGKIYIHGGNVTINGVYTVLADFHSFDTRTGIWTDLTPKNPQNYAHSQYPNLRSSHRMVTVGNKIYMFGGGVWKPDPNSSWLNKYNDIYCYDPVTNIWTKLSKEKSKVQPNVCTFSMVFSIAQFVFVFGGQSMDSLMCSDDLFCFDTVTQEWSQIDYKCTGDRPRRRDVGTVSVVGNRIILFAGSSGGPINDLNILEPEIPLSVFYRDPLCSYPIP
jgi:hypothetical protein